MAAGPAIDAAGGGGGGPAGVSAATASGSYGLVRTVVGYSTTHLFFWLLTVALVAAIHIASSGSKPSRSDEEERKKARRDALAAAAAAEEREREASARGDDRVLEMMRSFSFMQATEEDFMQGMTEYEYGRVDAGGPHAGGADEFVAPEPFEPWPATQPFAPAPAPASSSSLSFSFQHQMPEIPRKTGVVLRELTPEEEEEDGHGWEEEKQAHAALESSVPLQSAGGQEHQDEEAEETEFVVVEKVEEQSQGGEITEEAPATKVVATTHNYQFLTERDFRGFVREPEAMTVRVQESFVPPPSPPPAQFLTERDLRGFVREPEAMTVRVQESFAPPPSSPPPAQFLTERDVRGFVREPEAMAVRVQESFVPPSSPPPAQFLKERDVREPEAMTVPVHESFVPPSSSPPPAQPEERRVVDVSPRSGRFLTERDFRPANEPDDVCLKPKQKRASSPSVASKGSAVGARTSIASEFSGFGDSDSESSASDDGYSVKELVVDSDSDWFLSEKDFPASARHSGNLKAYKAKVLKAIEALEAAAKLEQSCQDSATTVSPGSVGRGSPDIIPDGSPKFPDDMWSRSPSPDVEYKEDEEKVTREAEAQYDDEDVEHISTAEEEGSDDEQSSISGKKLALAAPVYDAAPVANNSTDHLDVETIVTLNDHSGEAVSDAQRSPEAVSSRELAAVSSDQIAVPDAKRSPEPSEKEFVGTVDHLLEEHSSDSRRETASESDPSYEIVFDDSRRPEPLETGFVGANDESHELISDVWKEIVSRNDQPHAMDRADEEGLDPAEEEYAGRNDHSNGLVSYEKKVSFSSENDQSYAVVSGEKSIPETPDQEFSVTEHRNGVLADANSMSESFREDEEQASDHLENAAREAYISVTGKAKVYDEDGEDPEAKWKDLTDEEEDELESLWEHQDLIEQLKLELKKVRSIGLPTILEESETPKDPMEDLKPWRIDAKFLREDPMDELNKFYKSYRERMRKFDILCYQKMYAIDFLQLRGPQQSTISLKSLSPTVTSILSHNFQSSRRRPEDPSERFLKELRYDLETVYVGQMCLSWEFLRWQYEQARDLPESDPYHSHQYNQVAGEFQQFQVVVQRFVEDESFKGPRLPNYINNRCVLRSLLQVPVIKEDSLKDRMEDQRKGNYVITSEELEDIMEDAMHILWEFIKADKVEMTTTSVLKGFSSAHVELQDPSDHDLMAHIHATLQKKEKRLKDLLRTGNCIVKKFKKPKEDRSNQNLFFSQVDMKLVARVLRMPRITSEQLQWCRAKLDKIILVDRKIHREASFLLFPC